MLAWVRLIGCGLLALLLLFFVVRPVMKRLTAVRAPIITPESEAVSEPWIAMPERSAKTSICRRCPAMTACRLRVPAWK